MPPNSNQPNNGLTPGTPPTTPSPVPTRPAGSNVSIAADDITPRVSYNRRTGMRDTVSAFVIILIALFAAVILTVFVFQQYQVDGPSMQPTLQTGNRLIVLKLPQTWAKLTGHPYIPARGNIIVFVEQSVAALNETGSNQLIKRVLALPGERVVVKDSVLTVYNKQYPNGFQPDKTLTYGKIIQETSGNIDVTVPDNQVFVCGDNRQNSLDSRIFGPVPVKNIVGKLVLRLTPVNEFKGF